MTEKPQAEHAPAAGTTGTDALTGDSPGFLDEVAAEASAESSANLTTAGAIQDIDSDEIDPQAGLGGGSG